MSDLLTRAKLAQGLAADTPILSHRITDTAIIFVANLGIKGCPKYVVLLRVSLKLYSLPAGALGEVANDTCSE